ncbi:response regulator [Patescibacteria group bacterium]|nr:response regulator [Patescibacteria group bacterium]MBU1890702.1 response regulator [Patescibacteria group bacterium]
MTSKKKKKIFIIEDEQTLSRSLSDKLKREGFQVDTEIDGVRGLKRVGEVIPDLLILDIILPGLSGLEILERLKAEPKTKKIPVLLVSNVDDEKSTKEGKALGAVNYLIKTNVTPSRILEEINKHI